MNSKTFFHFIIASLCVSSLLTLYLQSRFEVPAQEKSPKNSDGSGQTTLFAYKQDGIGSSDGLVDITQQPEPVPELVSSPAQPRQYVRHTDTKIEDVGSSDSDESLEKLEKVVSAPESRNFREQEARNRHEVEHVKDRFEAPDRQGDSRYSNYQKILESNPYKKLGLYGETMPKKFYNMSPKAKLFKYTRYYGIKKNQNYCQEVDLFNLYHPQNIFNSIKFVTDYAGDEILIRKYVMPRLGEDVLPKVRATMPIINYGKALYTLPINATMLFFKRVTLHHYYEINKQMICLSQMYNHIPGHGVLTRKDLVVDSIKDYMKKYENKPYCLKDNLFFPEAYRLNDVKECMQFFKEVNSEAFQKAKKYDPIQYIIKVGFGAHRARGLALFDNEQELALKEKYENGAACGKLTQSLVAQRYISNPLLLNKQNKFDFRMYMLVASVNPLIVYYHDGFLRVSLSTYDKFSNMTNVHFTNTHLSKKIFAQARQEEEYDGMNEKELRDYQMWSLEQLQTYLLETGKITDPNWLDNELRPKFKEAFIHLARMAQDSFYKSASVFELYGLDFVIDENLNIWFIECNASPQFVGTNNRKAKFLGKMLLDMFEIQYSYFRSRMKRIFLFIRSMQQKAKSDPNVNYGEWRKEFDKLNINKFEPEVKIRAANEFVLIMDQNLEGPEAYFGNLREECIDF